MLVSLSRVYLITLRRKKVDNLQTVCEGIVNPTGEIAASSAKIGTYSTLFRLSTMSIFRRERPARIFTATENSAVNSAAIR